MGRGDLFGPSDPAIVAVDLRTGYAWRALEAHQSLQPEEGLSVEIEGRPIRVENPQGEMDEPGIGLDPIVIDPANEWVYYGSIHGTSVYRVRAADLLDSSLPREELHARVERYGEKPPCDGISIDAVGNVYVTDLENNAVGVTAPDGSYRVLASDDERLSWPDGFSFGPDGRLYVAVSQLHRSAVFNAGDEASRAPFEVMRLRPLAPWDARALSEATEARAADRRHGRGLSPRPSYLPLFTGVRGREVPGTSVVEGLGSPRGPIS